MTLTFLGFWKKSKSWLDFKVTWLFLKKLLSEQVCLEGTLKVKTEPQFNFLKIKTLRSWVFSYLIKFFYIKNFFLPIFREGISFQKLFLAL